MAGPTGCGLCGIESVAEALRPPPRVRGGHVTPADIIGRSTRCAAPGAQSPDPRGPCRGFWQPGAGLLVLREDVGRHNALDKLGGALARDGIPAHGGMVLLTSRVSVEMVQKAAVIGVPVVVAVSAPTALAVRTAEMAGITLVAVARADGFEVFTHPRRIAKEDDRPCRLTGSSTWPIRSAGSSPRRGRTKRSPARPITSRNSGTLACAPRSSRMSRPEARARTAGAASHRTVESGGLDELESLPEAAHHVMRPYVSTRTTAAPASTCPMRRA